LPYSDETNSLGRLNNLKSIEIRGHRMFEKDSNWDLFYGTICGRNIPCSIERVKHSSHLISDSIKRFPFLNAISIFDSPVGYRVPYIPSLLSIENSPTEFSFISSFPVNMTEFVALLEKWNPKLQSLTFSAFPFQFNTWISVLINLFGDSKCLKELSIIISELSTQKTPNLFTLFENQLTLSKLTLYVANEFPFPEHGFMELYSKLISSLVKNSDMKFQLKNINLISEVEVEDYQKFSKSFSNATASLIGKGFTLNGIPVERIVDDLSSYFFYSRTVSIVYIDI